MLEREIVLPVLRKMIQESKCDMERFSRLAMSFFFLSNAFDSWERHERDCRSKEYGTPEYEEARAKITNDINRINELIARISIDSQMA